MKHSVTILIANDGEKNVSFNSFEVGTYKRGGFVLEVSENKPPVLYTPSYDRLDLSTIFEKDNWESLSDLKGVN